LNIIATPTDIKARPGVVDKENGRSSIVGHRNSISNPTTIVPKQNPSQAIPADHPTKIIAAPATTNPNPLKNRNMRCI
jgi:hypothetical protein